MVLMNRPRIVDKDLGSLGNMSSTYRDNFNVRKDLSFSDRMPDFSYTKSVEPTNKKGLNDAAQALYAGTTKSTCHLPGFKGHIPANVRNYRKLEHSSGETHHPVANNLRLTQRGMGCVLGYTGQYAHSLFRILLFCADTAKMQQYLTVLDILCNILQAMFRTRPAGRVRSA